MIQSRRNCACPPPADQCHEETDVSGHRCRVQRRRGKQGHCRSRPSPLCSAISGLSLVLACDSVTNVSHHTGAPSPFLALMKEQKSLEAIAPKCPSSSLKSVPALIPLGSSCAVKTTACHADHSSLAISQTGLSSPQEPPGQHTPWCPRYPSDTAKDQGTACWKGLGGGGRVLHTPKPCAQKMIFFKGNPLWIKVRNEVFLIPPMSAQQWPTVDWTLLCLAPCTSITHPLVPTSGLIYFFMTAFLP